MSSDTIVSKTQGELDMMFAERAERAARAKAKEYEDTLGMSLADAVNNLKRLTDLEKLPVEITNLKKELEDYRTKEANAAYEHELRRVLADKFTSGDIVFKAGSEELLLAQLKTNGISLNDIESGLKTIATKFKVLLEEVKPSTSNLGNQNGKQQISTPVRPNVSSGGNTTKNERIVSGF